jgi:hypothetical protein
MKKMLALLIAGTSLTAASYAQTTVSSANIVGYAQVTVPSNGYVMVAYNFETGNGATYFEDVFGTNQLFSSPRLKNCEIVYMWDPVEQQYKQFAQYNGMTYSTDSFDVTPTNPVIRGGFFIKAATGQTNHTIYLSGNVPTNSIANVGIAGGGSFNLINYPFSSDIAISNLNVQGATSGSRFKNADMIYKWVNNKYEQYTLFTDKKWYNVNDMNTPTTDTVNFCEGFWYKAVNSTTWSASNVYYNAIKND